MSETWLDEIPDMSGRSRIAYSGVNYRLERFIQNERFVNMTVSELRAALLCIDDVECSENCRVNDSRQKAIEVLTYRMESDIIRFVSHFGIKQLVQPVDALMDLFSSFEYEADRKTTIFDPDTISESRGDIIEALKSGKIKSVKISYDKKYSLGSPFIVDGKELVYNGYDIIRAVSDLMRNYSIRSILNFIDEWAASFRLFNYSGHGADKLHEALVQSYKFCIDHYDDSDILAMGDRTFKYYLDNVSFDGTRINTNDEED